MPVPSKADQLCEEGKSLLKTKKVDEAQAMLELAIQENDRHVAAHETLAAIYFARKEYAKAAASFQKAALYDPRRVDPLINLGAVQNRMGDYQLAVKTLRQAISRDRKNATAYYNLGIAQKGLNQPHLAVSAYKEAIKFDPKMVEAMQNLANLYIEMGNIQQAQTQFIKALEIRPDFERARRGLEKSRAIAEEKKKAVNPFGRLVNMEELSTRAEVKHRKLTPQQQYEDRTEVHRMVKECEQAALAMLSMLRDRIGPMISRINQTFLQADDSRLLMREYRSFENDFKIFDQVNDELRKRSESLRQHEAQMRHS